MKVLGIDPGTRVLGYAVLECAGSACKALVYGVVRTKAQEALPVRLNRIYSGLTEIMAAHSPDVVAIEKVFLGKNIQSALRVGEARGVALLAAANRGLEVYEYDATRVKKAVVGSGAAHKSQIQYMLKNILGLPEIPAPTDASDALAIALCHCQQAFWKTL